MYDQFVCASQSKAKLAPKSTRFFDNKLEKVRAEKSNKIELKAPYKMNIFNQVESKVKSGLKKGKSSVKLQNEGNSENIDRLIENIENELRGSETR